MLFVGIAPGFLAASLQIAVPLHAEQCSERTDEPYRQQHDPSDTSKHNSDGCAICHYIFGLSGKTLPPQISAESIQSTSVFVDELLRQQILVLYSSCRVIPRAPPV
jgi:hypothetical protein